MSAVSSAYVSCVSGGRTNTWHFTGVTAIEHNMALNLDNTSSQGMDIVNGARNLPSQVRLSVVETDTEHSPGWAARMLEAMAALKWNRVLCSVVTSMGSYDNMLLSEIVAMQDEDNQDGWSGDITFVQYMPTGDNGVNSMRTNTNSSVQTNIGTAASTKLSDSSLEQALQRAGVN